MPHSKYLPVNWIDGMRISKDHFIAADHAVTALVGQTAGYFLNHLNYGLLAPSDEQERSLKISMEVDARNVLHVRLTTCLAITRGGILIDISHESGDQATMSISVPEATIDLQNPAADRFYLVLTVDPFKRMPAGEADPEENPPRNPFTIPFYALDLVPVGNIIPRVGENFLVIGFVKIADQKAHLSESFIPPCCQVRSHPALIDLHDRILHFLLVLERGSLEIIGKIHVKRQKSTLSATVLHFNEQMLVNVTRQVSQHRMINRDLPPVFMLEAVSQLARLMMNVTDAYPDEYREEMINYYSDWCNLKQGEFEAILKKALDFAYVHEQIRDSVIPLISFMEMITLLYKTLSGLEYIGKPKELGVYIKEELKTKRPLFTDD